jgi:hypothetical protein
MWVSTMGCPVNSAGVSPALLGSCVKVISNSLLV